MDFSLTDDQKQIRDMVREFAESEIKPHVMEWDEAQSFPLATVKKLGELGMLGAIFPEEYGGVGPHRARLRLRRLGAAHDRDSGRRRLGPQRHEELHHQRELRRHLRRPG